MSKPSHLPDLLDQVDELKRRYRLWNQHGTNLDPLIASIERLQAQLAEVKRHLTGE